MGSNSDDVPPGSQMLGGGVPRGVHHEDRLTALGLSRPAIHHLIAGLLCNQFQ